MALPEVLRKSKRLKPGTKLRVTEAGENILRTPAYRHLLRLEKPFGIRVVDDREFLSVLREQQQGLASSQKGGGG